MGRPERSVLLYILIEHQSKPDPLMMLRLLEYMVHIYRRQIRRSDSKRSAHRPPLDPVLPLVLYTGIAKWESLASMAELVAMGNHF
jgi:hypothetical protein